MLPCVVCFPVKEECVSEDEDVKDTLVEQILQQGDTAIIYPEAPEDDQSPAETGGADENGTVQAPPSTYPLSSFLSSLHPSPTMLLTRSPSPPPTSLLQARRTPSPSCTHARTARGATSAMPH